MCVFFKLQEILRIFKKFIRSFKKFEEIKKRLLKIRSFRTSLGRNKFRTLEEHPNRSDLNKFLNLVLHKNEINS